VLLTHEGFIYIWIGRNTWSYRAADRKLQRHEQF
jgi:hypothetical protein